MADYTKLTRSSHGKVGRATQLGTYAAALAEHKKRKRLRAAIEELDAASPIALSGAVQAFWKEVVLADTLGCLF
jgi:hypothetical protein